MAREMGFIEALQRQSTVGENGGSRVDLCSNTRSSD